MQVAGSVHSLHPRPHALWLEPPVPHAVAWRRVRAANQSRCHVLCVSHPHIPAFWQDPTSTFMSRSPGWVRPSPPSRTSLSGHPERRSKYDPAIQHRKSSGSRHFAPPSRAVDPVVTDGAPSSASSCCRATFRAWRTENHAPPEHLQILLDPRSREKKRSISIDHESVEHPNLLSASCKIPKSTSRIFGSEDIVFGFSDPNPRMACRTKVGHLITTLGDHVGGLQY